MTEQSALVIVVGMTAEAAIVATPGIRVVISGGKPESLAGKLTSAKAVVSFGLCGGLDPSLKAGDLIIDSSDPLWRERLRNALPLARVGRVTGSDVMVAGAADKAALRAQTGADGVDMESHWVMTCGAPWAIIRAVSDPADHTLPAAALVGLKANGDNDLGAVLKALALRPWELPALIRTGHEAGAALRSLRNARDLLGPGIGLFDLRQHLVDMA